MADFWLVQEQFNNLTWDIELNPSSFWLFMRDIEEASLNLKTAIYSGNVNLTADFYKQIEKIAEKKYALISPDGTLSWNYYERYLTENWELADYTMDWKSPWLYMDHQRLWYWNGTDWKAFIANDWSAFFWSNLIDHYLYWNWSVLKVRWDIEASSISSNAVITNTIRWWKTSYSDSTAWYWLWLDLWIPKLNLWNSTNSLNWNWTQLNIKGNITAWNISWVNISWSTLTSISSDSFTTLLIDWWFITLTEEVNFSKNTIKPNWINISSSTWSEYTLILIEPSRFQGWQYINWKITMWYEWLNSSWWFITSNDDWLYMESIWWWSTLWIWLDWITMTGVNVVWNWSRTLAWYFSAYINNWWRYVPYYN